MKKFLPSRQASKILGLHPNTLRYYADNGTIETFRTARGHRRYNVESFYPTENQEKKWATICYCRVSSPKQRDDLERQVEYMRERYPQSEIVKDIGSGLNDKRRGFKSLLGRAMQAEQLKIVVAHKDRLKRFGFDLIEWIIKQNDGEIVVLNQTHLSPEQELVTDILAIIHVFSCRLHGLRNYKSQINQTLSEQQSKEII